MPDQIFCCTIEENGPFEPLPDGGCCSGRLILKFADAKSASMAMHGDLQNLASKTAKVPANVRSVVWEFILNGPIIIARIQLFSHESPEEVPE